jgi:hypothetical protein
VIAAYVCGFCIQSAGDDTRLCFDYQGLPESIPR